METKDLIGLLLIPMAIVGGTLVSLVSTRARDAAFFLMITTVVIGDRVDINFMSQQWYRGSTRGFEVSLVDILAVGLIVSTFIKPRPGQVRWFWPASLGLMGLFFLYAITSVSISEPRIFGLFELSKMFRAILVFLAAATFVRGERELRILVLALSCAVSLQGALAIKHRLMGVDRATGTLQHANSLSLYLCMTAPVLVAAAASSLPRLYRYASVAAVGFATIGILLTVSRAGIPIFAVVTLGATLACVSWKITPQKIAVTLAAVAGVTALVLVSWNSLVERYSTASLNEEVDVTKFENRGQYFGLARVILSDRPLGVGLNNWSYWVSKKYGAMIGSPYEDYDDIPPSILTSPNVYDWSANYAPPAHNLAVITAGELGWPGLALFGLLWLRWFLMGAKFIWRRFAQPTHLLGIGIFFGLWGAFFQSLTEWVFRQTAVLLTFHILLGTLASLSYLKQRSRKVKREPFEYVEEPEPPHQLAPSPSRQR